MKTGVLLLLLFLTAVVTSAIYISVYYFVIRKDTITKTNCNAPLGAFAVNPGKTARSSSPTVSVNNLEAASNLCIANSQCKSFVYDENGKTMQIVNLTSTKSNDSTKSLYTLQTGVST